MKVPLTRRNFLKVSGGAFAGAWTLSLFGCGGDEGSNASEVTLFHDKPQPEGEPGFGFAEAGKLAEESIGIKIDPAPFSDTTAFQQGVRSSLRSGDTPGLFTWWSGYRLEELVEKQGIQDVSSIWVSQIENGNVPEDLASAFTFEDKQYAIPSYSAYYPVFYNKRVFEENELQPPQTWDELTAVADALKEAGVTPFLASIDGRWPALIYFEELLIRTDPGFYERLMQGEESYTDPVVVEVMEQWKAMIDKGYFNDNLDIGLDRNAANEVAQGNVAMMVIGTWFTNQLVSVGMTPGDDLGTFVLPNVNPDLDEKVIIVETGAMAIPANAPNSDASREVAEWWMGPEAQSALADSLQDVSYNPKVEAGLEMLSDFSNTVSGDDYRLMQRYWEATPPQIVENAVDELVGFMLNPNQYMEVLENIEEIAQNQWRERSG